MTVWAVGGGRHAHSLPLTHLLVHSGVPQTTVGRWAGGSNHADNHYQLLAHLSGDHLPLLLRLRLLFFLRP